MEQNLIINLNACYNYKINDLEANIINSESSVIVIIRIVTNFINYFDINFKVLKKLFYQVVIFVYLVKDFYLIIFITKTKTGFY